MLLNILGFNLSWFGLILLGNLFIPVSLFWLGLHIYRCKQPKAEIKLIISIVLIGTLVDTALLSADILIFSNQYFIPLWLITLWSSFATTIAHSLNFLENSKVRQSLIGFFFPPLSYIGGASFTSVGFGYNKVETFLILGSIWSILMVLFFYLSNIFYTKVTTNE